MKKLIAFLFFSASLSVVAQTYTIYPIPQSMTAGAGTVAFTTDVNVVCENGIDQATKNRLNGILAEHGLSASYTSAVNASKANILLGINGSGGVADGQVTNIGLDRSALTAEGKYDRHALCLWKSGNHARLVILGENTDAVFFGLASLEQMMDQYAPEAMPAVTIGDYADLQSRGLVEGYYGYPYSISVKKDLFRFMMRYKMNTYLYGAKSDPYHSQYWQDAYPTSITPDQKEKGWLTQQMLREITEESAATKVNFIWAIHPGNSFINSNTVVNDILGKFDKMYRLGVRQFAIFVDDVGLPNSSQYQLNADRLTAVQRGLERKYNVAGAAPEDTVRPVHFVPQIYATSWVGAEAREGFYTALASTPKNVVIYTTGWGVWSIPNSSDLNVVRQHLGRDVAWWWNYPCNDNSDGQIYTKDMYANFFEMPAVNSNGTVPSTLTGGIGIVSNPMQEGELSKIALFSVADYSWHTAGFNNTTSYEAAVRAVVGQDDAEDFAFLSDYLRWNDPADFGSLLSGAQTNLDKATNSNVRNLRQRLERLSSVCQHFMGYKESASESDRLLYRDIAPWLLKLNAMTSASLGMMDAAQSTEEDEVRWPIYVTSIETIDDLATNTDYTAYALEGMGNGTSVSWRQSQPSQKYFLPFTSWIRENTLPSFFSTVSARQTPLNNLPTNPGSSLRALRNSSTKAYYLSASGLEVPAGCFVGISLPQTIRVGVWTLDESLKQRFAVKYSDDFREWHTLSADESMPTDFVKYVIFENQTSEAQTITLNNSLFNVGAEAETTISDVSVPEGGNAEDQPLSNLTDGNYDTWWAVKKNQDNGDIYMLTLAELTTIRDVRICIGTKNDDYMNSAQVEGSANGSTWTTLRVKGSTVTTFNLSGEYVVNGGEQMKYVDFDGAERKAKYVRLRVINANTAKWLRLFEFEVNKHSGTRAVAEDANGTALPQVTDAKPNTSAMPTTSSFTYRFVQPYAVTGLRVYSGSRIPVMSVDVTVDGSTWTHLTNITSSMQRIDLSGYPEAQAVRFSWSGKAPNVYEIVEENDKENVLPTAIGKVTLSPKENSTSIYDLQGRRVVRPEHGGVYVRGGRKLVY